MDVKKTETKSIVFSSGKDSLEFVANCDGGTAFELQVTASDENGDTKVRLPKNAAMDLQRWLANLYPAPATDTDWPNR